MNDSFKHRCSRRTRFVQPATAARGERPFGAGSGGEVDPQQDWGGSGNHAWYNPNGDYTIAAYTVTVEACAGHPRVEILAVGQSGPDSKAFVNVHADKGIRMTTGADIDTNQMATDGVDIITEGEQTIVIERGAGPASTNIQRIQIEPSLFLIDANLGDLMIKSMKSITIEAAGGLSSITMDETGITMQGPIININ